jgi:hypothetical protein
MKKIASIIALIGLCFTAGAQSIPQDVITLSKDVAGGPWGLAGGYGHSITGVGNNVAFEVLTYDLVTNVQNTGFSSGAIAGYDQLWGNHLKLLNSLSGGWQFSETMKPFAFVGSTFLTNVEATVCAYQLVATPEAGNDIGSITGTSVAFNAGEWSGFHLKLIGLYEDRNGQGGFNGNYLLGGLAITHNF